MSRACHRKGERRGQPEEHTLRDVLKGFRDGPSFPELVNSTLLPGRLRVLWRIDTDQAPLVSIVMPTRNRPELLARSARAVLGRTDYELLELLIVDDGSAQPDALALLDRLHADPRVRVLAMPGPFNYSAPIAP